MSQAALAAAVSQSGSSFHQQTVVKVEQGTRPLKLGEAKAVAAALNARVADLWSSSEEIDAQRALRRRVDRALKTVGALHDAIVEWTYAQGALRSFLSSAQFVDHDDIWAKRAKGLAHIELDVVMEHGRRLADYKQRDTAAQMEAFDAWMVDIVKAGEGDSQGAEEGLVEGSRVEETASGLRLTLRDGRVFELTVAPEHAEADNG